MTMKEKCTSEISPEKFHTKVEVGYTEKQCSV